MAAVIYILWFLFLYILPAIVLFKMTAITPDMMELRGLTLIPRFNAEKEAMSLDNNFHGFLSLYPHLKKINNIVIKILQRMCNDAEKGNVFNPNVYILKYKNTLDRFAGYVFLGTFIPFLMVLILDNDSIYNLLVIQAVCLVLILILHRLLSYRFEIFQEIFWKHWYDKILNFDLISINMIRPYLLNMQESPETNALLSAVKKLAETVEKQSDLLMNNTNDMSLKLDEFIRLQKPREGITCQNTADSLNDTLKKTAEIGANLDDVCEKIERSLNSLIKITEKDKLDINTINKNASLLSEIKKLFTAYRSEALSAEISNLQKVTSILENNISNVFALIDETIKTNASGLSASYGKFSELCKKFTDSISENQNTKKILQALNDYFLQNSATVNEQTALLENAIKETSSSTRRLCESVYDFTQPALSPTFMEKIRSSMNYSQKPKDTPVELISYDNIVKEYEQNYDISVQKKLEEMDKAQNILADKIEAFQNITDIDKRIVNLEERLKQLEKNNAEKKDDDGSVYYISFDDSNSGPYKLEQLIKKIKKREITKEYYIAKDNSAWTHVSMLPELSSYFSEE
jgi:hypothetical protein